MLARHMIVGLYFWVLTALVMSGCASLSTNPIGECRKLCITEKVESFRDENGNECVCRRAALSDSRRELQ